jgi:hypothetical protein
MRSDTVVPVEDPLLSSQRREQQQERQQQGQDFALLRARALSLARALSSPSAPSSSSPSLATAVEVLASQVAALPPIDENKLLMAEEGWLVAAVADLRARVRSLSLGGDGDGGEATATAATATAATPEAAAPAAAVAAFAPALSQRFERTTLKFFMPGSSSSCLASRRLRLELGRTMALAG